MKTIIGSALVLCSSVWMASPAAGQTPVGALAINESQGDQYGWAVGYETAAATDQGALSGPVVDAGLDLNRATRRLVHEGPQVAGFDAVASQPTFREREPGAAPAASPSASLAASVTQEPRPASAEQDESPRRAGDVFLDCEVCPEMVVLAGSDLAMGRFEVTVGEYRAFASATGSGTDGGCVTYGGDGDSWRNPGFSQTDRHPVMCVSWDDVQEYLSWLSRTTGATYRLPTELEWERAAAGSPTGCGGIERTTAFFAGSGEGTCEVGTNGINAAGLYDMVGNAWEWMSDCWEGDCGRRVVRGGSWYNPSAHLLPSARGRTSRDTRVADQGFRVLRTLD